MTQATFRSGFEGGDFLYGPYGASQFAKQSFAAGMNLEAFQSQLSDYVNSLHRIGQEVVPQFLSIYLQTAQNFKETCPDPHRLVGVDYFDEDEWLPVAIAKKNFVGRNILSINKLVLAYYFDVARQTC